MVEFRKWFMVVLCLIVYYIDYIALRRLVVMFAISRIRVTMFFSSFVFIL